MTTDNNYNKYELPKNAKAYVEFAEYINEYIANIKSSLLFLWFF